MLRFTALLALLAFTLREWLLGLGVPVDAILGYGSDTVGAVKAWDRHDATAMALISLFAFQLYRKRPNFLRRKGTKDGKPKLTRFESATVRAAKKLAKSIEREYLLKGQTSCRVNNANGTIVALAVDLLEKRNGVDAMFHRAKTGDGYTVSWGEGRPTAPPF